MCPRGVLAFAFVLTSTSTASAAWDDTVFAPSFEHTGSVLVALLGLLLTMAWREMQRGRVK